MNQRKNRYSINGETHFEMYVIKYIDQRIICERRAL
jgi:hypothetical protein